MTTCDHKHAPGELCTDRKCYWTVRNPFWRLQRRFDRKAHECQSLRESLAKRMTKGGGA